jgi:uncharacterized protein (UPF0548 family)
VFRLTRPTQASAQAAIAEAGSLPQSQPRFLAIENQNVKKSIPHGYAHDHSRLLLGGGAMTFAAARQAFERWVMFDLGWVRVANPKTHIAVGQVVAVEAHTLGLWTVNLSRIVDVVNSENAFGFVYATTANHVENGEERFLLEFQPESGEVWYDLEAISRPENALAWVGFPLTRHFQHRFARESQARMLEEVCYGANGTAN